MDISAVGQAMNQKAQIDTLESVNISLLKTSYDQNEQLAVQLLESVVSLPVPEGNKGKNINTTV